MSAASVTEGSSPRRPPDRAGTGSRSSRRAREKRERGMPQTLQTRATPQARPVTGETDPAITATASGPKGLSVPSSRAEARPPS
jgi:hypothetical protein